RERPLTSKRQRTHWLLALALLLLLALPVLLSGANPRAGGFTLLVLATGLSYLSGSHLITKARLLRAGRHRGLLYATPISAAGLFLLSLLVFPYAGHGWPLFLFVGLTAMVVFHFLGGARGRRRQKEKDVWLRESALAHRYLDGLIVLEIGGSAHNPFGLNTMNIDYTASTQTVYKQAELQICGKQLRVDIAAQGDELPFCDDSQDFVVTSHVLEHFPDPIKALKEWYRVTRPGGYLFMIIPHRERTSDRDRPRTTLAELIDRDTTGECASDGPHCSVWITEDVVELIGYLGWEVVEVQDVDDKVGNGFAVVVRKDEAYDARVGETSGPATASR
ncbi:MAG: methyltransferase domain-containing protein, partial [Armatimonadetes bacterium]|nr:methyltransferase domain-containing protein [Armatimonadota bacterium]